MKTFGANDIHRLLPMQDAIEVVQSVMIQVAEGKANLPLRSTMDIDGTNKLGIMPGALSDPTLYGVKLLSLFPGNPARGLSSHIGVVILFDAETGAPVVSMNADAITAIRTAAASAAATRALSRPNAHRLAIIGTGEQAETHIEALCLVRDISEIRIAGRSAERAKAFVDKVSAGYPGIRIQPANNVQDAVAGADIVCTVTSSPEVILRGSWIGPGTHVNAVGASVPTMQEIDQDLLLKSELFVDFRASALAQAREIITALDTKAMTQAHIRADIGDVYRGLANARSSDDAITLYRSLGIAAQDLACADHVRRRAADPSG
jgi:ornithine cyclodeaminase